MNLKTINKYITSKSLYSVVPYKITIKLQYKRLQYKNSQKAKFLEKQNSPVSTAKVNYVCITVLEEKKYGQNLMKTTSTVPYS